MEFDVFGPDAAADGRDGGGANEATDECLFVLGWGNRPEHRPVRWLIDRITDAGWRVHTATLPVHVTDVRREWVTPVERYAADLAEFAVLAHSAGGLTAAHATLDGATTRTYLSPWWDYPLGQDSKVRALIARLPTDAKFLPSGIDDTSRLGGHATERQLAGSPDHVSPRFLRATREAHRRLPDIDDDAVVFCSLSDRIVSTRAVGDNVESDRIVLYDGGHELFSSASRESHIETLLAVLEDGPDALD